MKPILFLLLFVVALARAEGDDGAELLFQAARLGNTQQLESLLASGVSPDLVDQYGHTPLYYAVAYNHTDSVELLLASHANPNTAVFGHYAADTLERPATPLQCAAELGNRRIASQLIEAGAHVNEKGSSGRTALHYANGHLDLIALLINKGVDINARDADGDSALDEAVWYGSLDTVALLVAHGARLDEAQTKTGATPINEAAFKGQTTLVQYLLQFRPNLQTADKHGYGPLENAVRMGKEDVAVLLLNAEAKGTETPESLAKAMDLAVRRGESAVVESLLQNGFSANGVLPSGATLLDVAAFEGALKVVDVLLAHNADPTVSGRNGNFALEDASLKGFARVASKLLEHGAKINQTNGGSGTTALYSAAAFGKGEVVKLLLERGANPRLCGKNMKTAYQAALENGFTELAGEIQMHGGGKGCEYL